VTAVFIADEESGKDPDVGVDHLCRDGKLNSLKSGPLYWVDSADLHPLVGSGTMIPWKLTFFGKRGHSGLPHNAINPILIAIEALRYILYQFHRDFPTHPVHVLHTNFLRTLSLCLSPTNTHTHTHTHNSLLTHFFYLAQLESKYGYEVSTTMKPTQWSLPDVSSINQIPEIVTVSVYLRFFPHIISTTLLESLSMCCLVALCRVTFEWFHFIKSKMRWLQSKNTSNGSTKTLLFYKRHTTHSKMK
jgi:acetylornithine deacetylase